MKMRKKWLILLLASALSVSVCACGSSNSDNIKEESSEAEVEEKSAKSESSESEEINGYGMTEKETEELVDIVKTRITEDYLNKYGIAPSDFVLSKTNLDVYSRYLSTYEYSGDDTYSCTSMWIGIDRLIENPSLDFMNYGFFDMITLGEDDEGKEMHREMAIESMAENWNSDEDYIFAIKESMDEQASDQPMNAWFMDSSEQALELDRCVYEGIAEFLNNMDKTRAAEILVDQYLLCDKEKTEIETGGSPISVYSHMLFENVICDNISFE